MLTPSRVYRLCTIKTSLSELPSTSACFKTSQRELSIDVAKGLLNIEKLLKYVPPPFWFLNPLTPNDVVRQQKKITLEDLFSSVLSQSKKYHPSGNLKFNDLCIFQSLKLRILMEKSLQFLLK